MVDTDDLALWYAINRLITNYWAEVDDNGGSHAHEFYEPEAVYTVGNNGSRELTRSAPSIPGGASTAPSPRVISSAMLESCGKTSVGPE
jgi:hypothetical protein